VTDLDDLLDDIFDGKRPALYSEFAGWVQGSRRFSDFATRYRGKIRSKLKNARDEGGVQDLRAELQTAALLLRDRRFTLEYEKHAASKQGGPDFTVTFKTHTPFNVEVRRIRSVELADAASDVRVAKVSAVLCDKVRQMPPSIVNLLWLHAESEITEADFTRAGMVLRHLAERKAEDFFARRGFEGAAGFLKHYHRLSGIVSQQASEQVLWQNALARHKVPREIATAIQRLGSL
jgi:hypothetical protein